MYCPEHILIHKSGFMLTMYGDADIPWRYVPLKWKLNPLRYELILREPRYIRINANGRWSRSFANFLYKYVRPLLCKWFGIHQRFKFRGGENLCHHCDIGAAASQHQHDYEAD